MENLNATSTDFFVSKEAQKSSSESDDIEHQRKNKLSYTFSTQPLETDLKKLLSQVTGRTDLSSITEVKLKVVTGHAGLHRLSDYTPRLSILTLDGSCISSFRDLGSCLKSLKTLSVARCNMKHLDGVWGFCNLEELNARENFITDPSPCSGVKKLSKLDLSNNQINDIFYFAFLRSCRKLRELHVVNNHFSDYKKQIITFIPQLTILDGEIFENCPLQQLEIEEEGYISNDENESSENDESTSSIFIRDNDLNATQFVSENIYNEDNISWEHANDKFNLIQENMKEEEEEEVCGNVEEQGEEKINDNNIRNNIK